MKKHIGIAIVLVLLAGCTAGGGASGTLTPSPAGPTGPSATSTPGDTGPAPSDDQVSWAGDVCGDTTALQTEVQGLASAAAAGGSNAVAAVSDQMSQVSEAAGTLVDTVKAAPRGTSDDPGYAAVQTSIDAVDQSLQTLQGSASQVEGATGAALVTALATVVVNAGAVLTDVAATARAITTAMRDKTSTIGQAFSAAPECAALAA